MRWAWSCLILASAIGIVANWSLAADPLPEGSAIVTDTDGKEVTLTNVKLTTGFRRLAWLADPKGSTEDERKGPLALEVREPQSTTFAKGIVTFVKVSHVESAKYDREKQVVNYGIVGLKTPLVGTLVYRNVNVLGISGQVDGKTTTFSGGVLKKPALKTVTFAAKEPLPPPRTTGTTWAVQIHQPAVKDSPRDPTLTVRNLRLLFQFPGGIEKLEDVLSIRKGAALPLTGTVKRIEILATDPNTNLAALEVETTTGPERIVVVPLTQELDQKSGVLAGFLGEVDVGWKLFPLHTIKMITLTSVKKKVE